MSKQQPTDYVQTIYNSIRKERPELNQDTASILTLAEVYYRLNSPKYDLNLLDCQAELARVLRECDSE